MGVALLSIGLKCTLMISNFASFVNLIIFALAPSPTYLFLGFIFYLFTPLTGPTVGFGVTQFVSPQEAGEFLSMVHGFRALTMCISQTGLSYLFLMDAESPILPQSGSFPVLVLSIAPLIALVLSLFIPLDHYVPMTIPEDIGGLDDSVSKTTFTEFLKHATKKTITSPGREAETYVSFLEMYDSYKNVTRASLMTRVSLLNNQREANSSQKLILQEADV